MPARAEIPRPAVEIIRQDVDMAIDQPFRRGGGRRPEDDAQAGLAENDDGPVQPIPFETPRLRLDPAPGELADPDISDAERAHPACVIGPPCRRPMLRIIADAKHAGSPVAKGAEC